MSKYRDVSFRHKRAPDLRKVLRRPSDAEARASVGRIVDILQQLVLARPEMIMPLEEIARGILVTFSVQVELRTQGRTPRPLAESAALRALLERLRSPEKVPRTRAIKKPSEKRKWR